MGVPLRKCVVAVVTNDRGQYLVGERSDVPGAWQLPQGGVEEGERADEAVTRELGEEMGCGAAEVIRQAPGEISYLFPQGVTGVTLPSSIKAKFSGQSQTWFLLRYQPGVGPDLRRADGEFSAFAWQTKEEIIANIVAFKREAYIEGFAALGL